MVEINKKILSIGDMLDGFPSTFARTIAEPIDQIIKLVTNKFGVKDGGNLVLRSIFKLDRGWRGVEAV